MIGTERRNLEEDNIKTTFYDWKVYLFFSMLAASLPIIIPGIQFGSAYYLWSGSKKPVDKKICTCPCWDTIFKGTMK